MDGSHKAERSATGPVANIKSVLSVKKMRAVTSSRKRGLRHESEDTWEREKATMLSIVDMVAAKEPVSRLLSGTMAFHPSPSAAVHGSRLDTELASNRQTKGVAVK